MCLLKNSTRHGVTTCTLASQRVNSLIVVVLHTEIYFGDWFSFFPGERTNIILPMFFSEFSTKYKPGSRDFIFATFRSISRIFTSSHRQSLSVKIDYSYDPHMTEKRADQLLELVDKGFDLTGVSRVKLGAQGQPATSPNASHYIFYLTGNVMKIGRENPIRKSSGSSLGVFGVFPKTQGGFQSRVYLGPSEECLYIVAYAFLVFCQVFLVSLSSSILPK